MSSSSLSVIGTVCFATVVLAQNPTAPPTAVPEVVVRAKCVTCHAVDLIQQQSLSRAGWEREVDKMIRWGAVVADPDRASLMDSLAAMSGPSPSATPAAGGRGDELFGEQCLSCHALDIVEQQRLGSAGWRREVDKMVGWGARVRSEDKDLLVTYLSDRFGVR